MKGNGNELRGLTNPGKPECPNMPAKAACGFCWAFFKNSLISELSFNCCCCCCCCCSLSEELSLLLFFPLPLCCCCCSEPEEAEVAAAAAAADDFVSFSCCCKILEAMTRVSPNRRNCCRTNGSSSRPQMLHTSTGLPWASWTNNNTNATHLININSIKRAKFQSDKATSDIQQQGKKFFPKIQVCPCGFSFYEHFFL